MWEYLLSDETRSIEFTEYEILAVVCALLNTYDCMGAIARKYFDTTPATVETTYRVNHAAHYIWQAVQDLYDGGDDVNLLVVFRKEE